MKKKILSLFLALAMCLSLLPTAAFAADGAQDPAEPGEEILAPEQLGDPEKDPDPEQEEQQADPSVKQDEAVAAVQALMDALPGEVTADNADELQAQLMAIDAALEALSDEQLAQFLTRYEAVCEALSSLTAVQAGETHEHYLCGGDTCNEEGHEEEKNSVTFTKWPGIGNVVDGGAYYLTGDVYGFTVPEGVNLTLCLNGFSITGNWDGPIVTVEPGATFTLCNCKGGDCYIGHDRNVYGAGVFVGEKDDSMEGTGQNTAAFYMYGGTIGGNSDSATKAGDYIYGSGVVVMGGTFYMYGGAIKNNSVNTVTNKSYGGGVSVFNNGTFNMSGGTITGNTGYYGGGVSVGLGVGINHAKNKTGGTFTMSGGRIYNNAATYKAGGVYVSCGSNTIFTVSGSAQITDNYLGSLYTRGADNNVYLLEGNTKFEVEDAIINVGTLDSSASIGVTTEKGEQIVATGVSAASAKRCFFSDDSTRRLQYDSAAETLTMVASEHEDHPICGASCTHNGAHANEEWNPVTERRDIYYVNTNYYLTRDLTISKTLEIPNGVTLCLNGYSIIANGDFDAITVGAGKTFTLCDCVGTGEITHTEGKTGRGVKVQGTFNLYGGAITGNKCSTDSSYGSGVYVDSGACFNMHGGSITGNENTVSRCGYGAGVYVNKGTFNMTGGSITKNTATYGAGVWTDVSFTVSGAAKIIDNSKDNAASNVYLSDNNKPITIGEGGLAASAKIGVTTGHEESIESGKHVTVATGAANSCTADNFSADKGGELGIKVEQGADGKTNVNLYNGLPHEHPICGDVNCTDHGNSITDWKGIANLSEITEDGNYYLTTDVELPSVWTCQYNVNLCLNGHSIAVQQGVTSSAIKIGGGLLSDKATLSICDCNGSKQNNGNITGAYSGVYVTGYSDFNLYGGKITGNTNGVYVSGGFHMYGGTIQGNSKYGVDCGSNAASGSGNLYVSGNVNITGNTQGNVYLPSNRTITVLGALGATAQIGVTTASEINTGSYVTVAKGKTGSNEYTLKDDDLNAFSSDSSYSKQFRDGNIVFTNGELHEHAICGKKAADCKDGHSDEVWTPLTSVNGKPYAGGTALETGNFNATEGYKLPAGRYYLSGDLTLNKPLLIKNGVYLCLNGQTLTVKSSNSAVIIDTGCDLTLCDCSEKQTGKITHAASATGRGVYMGTSQGRADSYKGSFTMYGGSISGNHVETGSGVGVYVCYGTFNMHGGSITDNTTKDSYASGGVHVTGGTFNMTGGSITDNSATSSSATGGGVRVDSKGMFNMSGDAVISNNSGAYSGGGVYVNTATFNMSGSASVSGNSADYGGGVYVTNGTAAAGTFTMSGDASVSGNSANYGGGVYMRESNSKFTMSENAAVSGNTAKAAGGGVNLIGGGTFTMGSGSITGNNIIGANLNSSGGGVYVDNGMFNMTGGTISGNNVTHSDNMHDNEGGGGVYVAENATMNVSGNVQITGNWKNGTLNNGVYEKGVTGSDNNLYLYAYNSGTPKVLKTVTIDSTGLASTAEIGITTRYTPTASNPIKIATGAQENVDYTGIFTPDMQGQGYTITLPEGETNLYLSAHTHDWEYAVSADNQTIIAECKDTTCTSSDGGSVTISKPKHEVYRDGKDATAKVTQNSWAADTVSDVTYKNYTGDETPLSPAPTDAGHYIASITVGGKTAWVDYEIGKATPTADDFNFTAPTDPTYNGEVKSADFMWVNGVSGMGKIGIRHYNESGEMVIPKDAGTYTVKITVAEGTNYKAAEAELTKDNWTFTILQADYTGQKSDKTIDIVKGRSVAQTGSLTVADFFAAETELPAGAKIASVTPASGAMMASVTVNDGTLAYTSATGITATADETYTVTIATTNYTDIKATLTFHPVEKQPQTSFAFEESAKTVAYGDDNVVVKATGQVAGSKVTYSSEDETVAVVDENTGAVVILKASTTPITIKATASATEEYAEKEISCTLTVSPKTLTADDLEFTANSTFTKEYDGTTNCTTATVQIKSVAKVNSGDALPEVKGAYAYDSKDAKGATKVTFTTERTENTNYILPAGLTVEHKASITKRVLTVGTVTATSKQYDGETDAEACIASVPLNGVVDGDSLELDTPTTDGSYYFTADFIDANAGQNKTINGTVVLYPNNVTANYTFKDAQGNETNEATFTTTGAIAKADSWALTPVTDLTIRYNNRAEQTYTPDWPKLLPAGQKWTYNLEDTKVTGSAALADHSIGADSGVLTYQLSAGAENDTITWTITASCNNYESFTLTVKLTLIARNEQTGFAFKDVVDGKVTKTYGDADFTVKATGANEYSEVTYESSDEEVATVDSTGKVTIKGAGAATITAKASATPDYEEKEISYALTVNKLLIPVPTKGKNELEYTGQEQTYLPDGLDSIYCTIESNKATDVIAGGSWHNADVSLKDRSNTEWADGADSIAHRPYPFRITPKPVTVTALDKKITAGQPAPELTSADYTVTGLIGNDTLGGISLYYADPSDLSKAVTPDTGKAGTYAIVVTKGGTGSNNYAPTFVNGTLTIASRPSGGVVAVTYPVNVPGETERGSVSSNVKNASKGSTVTITVEPEDGFQLADLTVTDKDGNELPLTDKGDGKYTFTMPAGKVEVNATFAEKIETSPFADVSTDAYYYEAVKWAAEQGITGGVGGGLFAPDQSCTRAQIVTFLWRAAGSPEPKSMRSFSDVPEDSYYAKAVAWAVENGITVGTSATTFSPDATCTRAQGVTFLFRAAKASADGAPAFRDVAADAYYAAAVKWATANSVTNGTGGGLFGSDNDCTRAQIVTFLWRLYAGK